MARTNRRQPGLGENKTVKGKTIRVVAGALVRVATLDERRNRHPFALLRIVEHTRGQSAADAPAPSPLAGRHGRHALRRQDSCTSRIDRSAARRATQATTRSDVAFRRIDVVAFCELAQPHVGLVSCNMQPSDDPPGASRPVQQIAKAGSIIRTKAYVANTTATCPADAARRAGPTTICTSRPSRTKQSSIFASLIPRNWPRSILDSLD